MKLEAIGPAEKRVESISFGLYGIHSSATCLMRERTDLLAHTYASEGVRERNRCLAYSRWDELRKLQLDMEDDIVNLTEVQGGLEDI